MTLQVPFWMYSSRKYEYIYCKPYHPSTRKRRMLLGFVLKQEHPHCMMTSSNGNIFRVTDHLCGEFTGPGTSSPGTSEFPAQRPVARSFDGFFFICTWINGWVNNGEAGDLRRYHTHYDVTVMGCNQYDDWWWPVDAGRSGILNLDHYSLRRHRPISIGIPIINIRRSPDHLRSITGISIPNRTMSS